MSRGARGGSVSRADSLFVVRVFVVWLLFAAGVYLCASYTAIGQRIDNRVLYAGDYTPGAEVLAWVSVPVIAGVLAVLLLLCWWLHGLRRMLALAFSSGLALACSQVLKHQVLPRPDLLQDGSFNTFPSGHATVFVVFAGALLWAVPRAWQAVCAIIVTIFLAVTSCALLGYAWHRPSDVFGAVFLTVACFALGRVLFGFGTAKRHRLRTFALVALALLVLAAALGLIGWGANNDGVLLNAFCVALVGVCVFAVRALRRLS